MIRAGKLVVHPADRRSGTPILNGIDIRFDEGTVTLLVGRTGSGKTTLLQTLAGLTPVSAGGVWYGDDPLWDGKRLHERAKWQSALAFQHPERQLFAETLWKEFRYSLRPYRLPKRAVRERAIRALERMKLEPDMLEESVLTLSEGQKRRAALAAVLAVEAPWLLLDEPTAGMDPAGVPPLLETIRAHKAGGGGVVVASHDLDVFFPVADRVIVLSEGRIICDRAPRELTADPSPLLEARVGLPASLRIGQELRELGIPLHEPGLRPEETAKAILEALGRKIDASFENAPENTLPLRVSSLTYPRPDDPEDIRSESAAEPEPPANEASSPTWIHRLNPVTKWWFYLLVSTGMLIQISWVGIAASAAVAAGCFLPARLPLSALGKPVKAFLFFMLISILLSGLQWNSTGNAALLQSIGFSVQDAARTAKLLTGLLLVMIMGVLFARVTGLREMRLGMEQALSRFSRFGLPARILSLYTSLLLRFLPQLFEEFERMSVIVRSRGKADVKPGTIRLRDTPAFFVPLLLSMMKHAEELAMVLEMRGYLLNRRPLPSAPAPSLTAKDRMVRAAAVLLLCLFIGLRLL